MVAKKPVALANNSPADVIVARDDDKVAFAVGPHRAIVQVCGADAQNTVVHDHHLGMDHGVFLQSSLSICGYMSSARSPPASRRILANAVRPTRIRCASSHESWRSGRTMRASRPGHARSRAAMRSAIRGAVRNWFSI